MPIPKPRSGETRQNFMNRCTAFVIGEGEEANIAGGICSSQWDRKGEFMPDDEAAPPRLVTESLLSSAGLEGVDPYGLDALEQEIREMELPDNLKPGALLRYQEKLRQP
jgi:hypothetical protein